MPGNLPPVNIKGAPSDRRYAEGHFPMGMPETTEGLTWKEP
jgi:hypothetical protein